MGHAPEQLHHEKTRLLPRLDSALSALVQDLSDRGLTDSTLVVVLSDFGRTPVSQGSIPPPAATTTRPPGSLWLAGGGIRPGDDRRCQTNEIGLSDRGPRPLTTPRTSRRPSITASASHKRLTHQTPDGRPVQVNYDGRPIRELI